MHTDRFKPLACVAGGFALCLMSILAEAAEAVTIGVRSSLFAPAGAETSGRIYSLRSIQQISSAQKVAPPVDVNALLRHVRQSLTVHGFQAVKAHQHPDIVLTVEYGRDWLGNPYLGDADKPTPLSGVSSAITGTSNGYGPPLGQLPNQTFAGAPVQLMNHIGTGQEARAQKAGYEKLYLRITAWPYPSDPKARVQRLWSTTMVVDDPEHSDLNVLAADLLAAGAPYFGRAIQAPELEVSRPVPDGRVQLGEPRVLDVPTSKPERKFPMQVSVSFGLEEPTKSFDLPAGEAGTTLREFARQADTEIIYPSALVGGIKTRAVSGELSPRAAVDRLLEGTGLIAIPDEKSGAFVIRQSSSR